MDDSSRSVDDIATHEPAPDSGFVIRADLAADGMPGRSEQLWAKQIAPYRFELRSLAFFAYGMRPGDVVETDDTYTVRRVVQSSGRQLLRVAAQRPDADRLQELLDPMLESLGLPHEWHQIGYVSIELPSESVPDELRLLLNAEADADWVRYELA